MIKVTDIQAGYLFKVKGEDAPLILYAWIPGENGSIQEAAFVMPDDYKKSMPIRIRRVSGDDIQPVNLTPEMMARLGFILQPRALFETVWQVKLEENDYYLVVIKNGEDGYNGLHELQHAYRNATGKDLPVPDLLM